MRAKLNELTERIEEHIKNKDYAKAYHIINYEYLKRYENEDYALEKTYFYKLIS